jgi:hypothetical protein
MKSHSIGRTPDPKKKPKMESLDSNNIYKYGAALCHLNQEPASVVQFYAKKKIPESVLYRDIDIGIDGYEPNPHITVMYGFKDNYEKTSNVCEGFGQIPVVFGKVDKFESNPLFDVIMIRIESEQLHNLNTLLEYHCDVETMFNSFEPHATLAYVNKGSCDHLVGDEFFIGLDDIIDVIHFSSKDGSEHPINL